MATVARTPLELSPLVAGKSEPTGDVYEIRSPYDGELVAAIHRAGPAEIERAIAAAVRAFETTRKLPYRMGGPQKTTLESFDVFCPKALAGIERLPSTVGDRSIPIVLKRKGRDETVQRFRRRDVEQLAEPLRERVETWASANLNALNGARPSLPHQLDDRAAEGWEPLLAIADLAGETWPESARTSALALSTGNDRGDDSLGVRLLDHCRQVFGGCDRLPSADLIAGLAADEEAPWSDWRGRGLITPRELSRLLKPYGISSRSIRLESGETPKGYLREQFEDAWSRYLPSEGGLNRRNATTASHTEIRLVPAPPHNAAVAEPRPDKTLHGDPDVADVAAARGMNGSPRVPLPGDAGFRELVNRAHAAGLLTERERFERRLLHDLVWRTEAKG